MAYTKRGPWTDGDPGAFDSDDLNAMDEAIARLGGGGVVDVGSIAGPVTIDMDSGGVFRATMTADAAFTFTNASLPSRRRAARLMLSTQGYVPTFPGSATPAGGLSGDYVGAVDQFDVETAPGHSTPMVQHVAEYGRYRAAFVGIAGTYVQTSFDGHTWSGLTTSAATGGFNSIVWSPSAKVFVQFLTLVSNPRQYGFATSRDGVNWTRQSFTISSGASQLYLLFNRHTGMLNVFSADGLTMYESFDGSAWATKAVTGLTQPIWDLDWSPTLSLYSATDFTGYNLTSTDGLAWTKGASTPGQAMRMRWVDGWGVFVAAGRTFVNTSPDATTWTQRFLRDINYSMNGIAFSDSRAVMTVSTTLSGISNAEYVSTDSASWGLVEPPFQFRDASASPVWNSRLGMWLMLYGSSPNSGVMYQTSKDAVAWDTPASFDPSFVPPYMIVAGD